MKKTILGNRLGSLAASSLAVGLLAGWATTASATTNVFSFDDSTSTANWLFNPWGGQGAGTAWDGTQDHTGGTSGSLHVQDVWQNGDQLVNLGWWGGSVWNANKPIDLTTYTNVSVWVKWDAAGSTAGIDVFQTPGETMQLWAVPADNGSWIDLGALPMPDSMSNGWVNVNVAINPALPGLSTAQGLGLKKWVGNGLTNTFAFWADDFEIQNSAAPLPPPSVYLAKPVTGLNLFAVNGPYNREMVYATNGPNSFIGHGSTPATYSMTIKQGVDGADGSQFQTHIMFIPGGPIAATETAPDWNEANAMWLDIESTTTAGQTVATFRYKTNQPNANSMAYDTNVVPAIITNTTLTGTWTLSVLNDNNFTITAPDGGTTNFTIPLASAQLFSEPTFVYFGVQANNSTGIGKYTVLSEAKITGTANPLDDNFLADSTINSNLWEKVAADPQGVLVIPSTARYWVQWTLPDTLFSLVSTPSLATSWASPVGVTPVQFGSRKWALINQANLPGANAGYFGLIKRTFTQLQVLLPGETNAPGTVSGKIGTPDPVSLGAGGLINVTVNACDPQWNIVSASGDTIHITTTDGGAALPNDTTLINGSTVQQFGLFNTGSTTFTATDVTDGTKTSNTSSAVTVNN